jgi:16S rRNA C967 or C1407 C5-methylase (RsmB/RsmF family)/NOL1/NOP2/fmu family ribosome biogenesis protein
VGSVSDALPEGFKERMRELLSDEFQAFLDSFDQPRIRGLRLNPQKTTAAELADLLGVPLEPVPWCPTGFTFPSDVPLGGHPAHLAGLFYLQEPSSMSPAEVLAPQAGWSVVDLAAAPGGKTTHLAPLVGENGLVVANEFVPSRLRPLHDNLDLWGATNVVTVSRDIRQLARLDMLFDGAVLDVPCSGEGLFRRNPASIAQWSPGVVQGSARRQARLLAESARLVRPGGNLVYSTCTFEVEENEARLADFLSTTPGWTLDDCTKSRGFVSGVPLPPAATERAARLWPHRVRGEGQFVARLTRSENGSGQYEPAAADGGARRRRPGERSTSSPKAAGTQVKRAWGEFHESVAPRFQAPEERLLIRDDRVFLLPNQQPPVSLDVLARPGLPLGRLRPGRFEPHPALATAMSVEDVDARVNWRSSDPDLAAFLRGDSVASRGPDGWVLVCFERWGIAWAKRSGGMLKNMLPRHLRSTSSISTRTR